MRDKNPLFLLVVFLPLCDDGYPMIDIYAEIRKRYGNVRRARGYYLYTEKNIRLLDLWLDGGKAVLGRRTGQSNLMCKQFFDRGLTGSLPTKADAQLQRALAAVLPDYPVIRWYETEDKAARLIRSLLQKNDREALPVWRPFLGVDYRSAAANTDNQAPFVTVPVGGGDIGQAASLHVEAARHRIVSVTPAYSVPYGIVAADSEFKDRLPPSDRLFPPLAYGLARAFFDVQRKIQVLQAETALSAGGEGCRAVPKKRKEALKRRAEAERFLATVWTRKSCYLFPHISEAEYPVLFTEALNARVLISPEYGTPSILPDCESYTELSKFLQARTLYEKK